MDKDDKSFFLTMFGLTAATVVATGYVLHNDIKSMKMSSEQTTATMTQKPAMPIMPVAAEVKSNIKKIASTRREQLRTKKLSAEDETAFRQKTFEMS